MLLTRPTWLRIFQRKSSLSTSIVRDDLRELLATDNPPSPLRSQRYTTTEQFAQMSDLPIELIERILDFCDYSTFLVLAQVNHYFNFYTTEIILIRELESWRSRRFSISRDTPHRDSILVALYIRQGAKYALSDFDYSFEDPKCFRRQAAAITRFIHNHVTSIDGLKLDLASAKAGSRAEALNARSKLLILLEAALAKGCQHVDLRGGICCWEYHSLESINDLWTSNIPRKRHRGRFLSWFRPSPTPPPPFFLDSAPTLNKLTMEACLMLKPFLLSHTLALLRSQSPTLRNLKIYQSEVDSFICEKFFSTVSQLPSLEAFTFTYKLSNYHITSLFTIECFFDFLARHPSIQKVKFHNVHPHSEPEYRSTGANTFLPNLKILHANAAIVSSLLRYPDVFSNLEHVSVAVAYGGIFGYEEVDDALIALGSRMNDSSMCGKSSIHLELRVCVDTDFYLWLLSQIANPGVSPVRYLTRVETLTLSTKGAPGKLGSLTLGAVITWASLFPNLRWLRLDDKSIPTDLDAAVRDEAFVTTLKNEIPLLERCSVGDWDWVK